MKSSYKNQLIISLFYTLFLSFLLQGCATPKLLRTVPDITETDPGLWRLMISPLPNMRNFYLIPLKKDDTRELVYRTWDMNSDGRIDILEVLNSKKEVTQRLYDYDLDGTIDATHIMNP